MNRKQIIELFKVNLLYANPQTTQNMRKRGKTTKQLSKSLLFQYTYLGILFAFLYGMIMLSMDFSKLPGFFTFYCLIFVIMAFAQSVSILHNVFYESKDMQDYLPLPFQLSSVFFAKFLIVGLTIIPFLLPILVLFILTAVRSGLAMLIGAVLGLILFAIFFTIVLSLSIILVSSLVQTKLFTRHKNILTSMMMIVPTIGMVAGMLYLNMQQTHTIENTGAFHDQAILYPFYPLFKILTKPVSPGSLISIVVLLAIVYLLYLVIDKFTVPRMYEYAAGDSAAQAAPVSKSKKKNVYQPLNRQLMHYNLSLIKNPTLIVQTFSYVIMFPVVMLFSVFMGNGMNLANVSLKYWVFAVMAGIAYSIFTINQSSVAALIISLDRENLLYVRSLPINFKDYLKNKFRFALLFQFTLNALVVLVIAVVVKLPILFILGAWIGCFIGVYLWSQFYFYRDYRFLTLNWTNLSQLIGRGMGNTGVMLSIFGVMIAAGILLAIIGVMVSILPLVTTLVALVLLTGAIVLVTLHYRKVFWGKDLTE